MSVCDECGEDSDTRIELAGERGVVRNLRLRIRLARRALDVRTEPEARHAELSRLLDLRKPLKRGGR